VEDIVDNYSSQYGQTKVFSLWSHSALDGPLGGIATSGNHALDEKQLTIEGWSKIEFNWSLYFGDAGVVNHLPIGYPPKKI